ncbi:MAG: type II toxin-antitoxin system RelE/ParE family toxin [Nanoarchaeota archaeon]|nr:type II toxin-antitoxin system RelE/ParE family toxin [Nanoarchaeota archaeon]MBU4308601.1 type II toxin-antitoxin system RelE/ParE family toxin [Nanoarchaeota archaeon]
MYKLIFEKKALQNLNKLDAQTKKRIWDKLQECKENPFRFLKPLIQIKGFKLRVGDYLIIIDVQEEMKILHILKVGHRKNIYER